MLYNAMLKNYQELSHRRRSVGVLETGAIVYPSNIIDAGFGKKRVLYADYIASGRPSPLIEKYIEKNIYSKYSNTHSNSTNGICMKNEIERVKAHIKRHFRVDDTYEILFKGSGTTAAVNHLVDCLDYTQYKDVHIFISSYEHYSNHLPWVELSKNGGGAAKKRFHIYVIPLVLNKNVLDLAWFESRVREVCSRASKKTLIIASITHASNVTGYMPPHREIRRILGKKCPNIDKYYFTDMATSAPYCFVDGSLFDAIFFSGHKFIGGVETPGVLIAKTCLFQKDTPSTPGGSCIKKTHYNEVEYAQDIEVRENAGSPNVVGIIKFGQCLELKESMRDVIKKNERALVAMMRDFGAYLQRTYADRFRYIAYDGAYGDAHGDTAAVEQLPVFSFHLTNLHYNLVVKLLNDLYGIQCRGGISCSGLLADTIEDLYGYRGFCRISFHWLMSKKDVEKIANAIEFVIEHGEEYKPLYSYCEKENLWSRRAAR